MKRILGLLLVLSLACCGLAGPIRMVPQNSPLRKQLLNMVRPKMERMLGMKVKFKVDKCVTQDGYAFVRFAPIQTNGKDINWKRSKFADAYNAGGFNPEGGALFRNSGGNWKLLTWAFGATDVYWDDWPQKYGCTRGLLAPPGN